jgi:hypothetical protein
MAVVSLIILMCISVVQIPFPHVERIVMYRETRGRDAQLWVTVPCAAKGSLRVFRDFGSNNWNSNSIFLVQTIGIFGRFWPSVPDGVYLHVLRYSYQSVLI